MIVNPVHRLRWLAAIAREDITAGAARVAIHIAEQARDGRMLMPTGTVASSLGVGFNTVRRAFDQLVALGFLVISTHATQHSAAIYTMARVPKDGQSDDTPGCPATGAQNQSRVPIPGNQGAQTPPPRVPKDGHQQGEQGDKTAVELARLRSSGAHMTSRGESVAGEWSDLLASHGLDAVLGALSRLPPRDKWPSRVRTALELIADLPGLTERIPTADEARAAMGLSAITGATP